MKLLLFLFGAALAAGLYFVLADMLKIPRLATERALISAGRKERSLVKSMETLILGWSLKLAPLIRLDAYKRRRLETKLTAAGLDINLLNAHIHCKRNFLWLLIIVIAADQDFPIWLTQGIYCCNQELSGFGFKDVIDNTKLVYEIGILKRNRIPF